MFRVVYSLPDSERVYHRVFGTLEEAVDFSNEVTNQGGTVHGIDPID